MVLSLKHRLSEEGYYWFNLPRICHSWLCGHTNFVGSEHRRRHVVYAGDYLAAMNISR
jgi:hypothetical protein